MNSGGTALLDRFKIQRSQAGATPSYTGGQWLKEGQNLFSSGFVRVAVIPVGEMETHKLQQWARTFQAYSHVKLQDIQLICQEDVKSPFKNIPWKQGYMHFSYEMDLDAEYVSCIGELERSRVFHGVIGVFECDRVVDVRETYAQYQQAAKRVMQLAGIPNPGCRLFGFGSDRAVQACRDAVLSNKEMEGLAALTRQEIEDSVMLGFCMLDFAGCMHMNLANAVLELQHKEMSLDTPVDNAFGSPNSGSARDPNVETRRKMARYAKRLGDLCLLAGAPQDAKEHYEVAISTGRSVGEYVFVACAHEGLAASVLLEVAALESGSAAAFTERYDQTTTLKKIKTEGDVTGELSSTALAMPGSDDGSNFSDTTAASSTIAAPSGNISAPSGFAAALPLLRSNLAGEVLQEATGEEAERLLAYCSRTSGGCVTTAEACSKIREPKVAAIVQSHLDSALTFYKDRGAWPLVAALKLKAARFHASISVGNWRPHVLAVLLSVMHEAVKMASIYDQLSAQVDCADVCEMLGAGRKRHLLLSEVIRVLSLRDAGGNSYMLRRVCESLGTQILRKPSEMTRQQVYMSSTLWDWQLSSKWKFAYMDLVKSMASAAQGHQAWMLAWRCGSKLLREYATSMRKEHQLEVLNLIEAAAEGVRSETNSEGPVDLPEGPPPLVKCAALLPLADSRKPVILQRKSGKTMESIFQYRAEVPGQDDVKDEAPDEPKQDIIWVQDESASVQVYVLNPCLVHLPRQMDQYLILTAACDHMLVSEDGTLTQSGSLQPFIAKSFQVQVPAGLNLQHRSVQDFAAKGCTTLKLRPREAGVAQLKGVTMTWGPAQFVQPWSHKLPGEVKQPAPLPSYQDKTAIHSQRQERVVLRSGVACTDVDMDQGRRIESVINIPIAPAQPLLKLSVEPSAQLQAVASLAEPTALPSAEVAAPSMPRSLDRQTTMLPDVPTESKAVEVTMLEGQCCMLPLAIENVGKFVVDRVLIDVESSSSLLSKYSKQAHPLVPFTGVFASVNEEPIASSLAPPSRGAARATSGRNEGSKCTVPLVLTAGMLQSPSSAASAQHTITITVSYWSEACQPKSPMIQALDNPAEQVLARQATLVVCVTVLRHMCVASVLSTPTSESSREKQSATLDSTQPQQFNNMDLTFQLARHGTEKAVKACVCSRDTVAAALQAGDGSATATCQSVCELLEGTGSVLLPAEAKSCSLHTSMPAFPAVKTFGKRLKNGLGFKMPPVSEQLQISSNHFAKSLVILWAIAKEFDGTSLDATEGLVWGTHVLTKQMFLEYQSISGNGLRRMMDAPIIATVQCQTSHGTQQDSEKPGDTQALTRELMTQQDCMLEACVQCQTHDSISVTVSWSLYRMSDDTVHMDTTLMPDRRRREHVQPQLFIDNPHKAAPMRVTQRIGTADSPEAPTPGAARRASPRITESFIGAGTLSTTLTVGTVSGMKTCSLHGLFMHEGTYSVSLEVESAVDCATGMVLSVSDYAVSHPLQLQVQEL